MKVTFHSKKTKVVEMFKIRYMVLVKRLKDGDMIETDGIIEGLTTEIVGRELHIGGIVRDTSDEII